eukprot:10193933-Prorocentrum_lima.AAC.1
MGMFIKSARLLLADAFVGVGGVGSGLCVGRLNKGRRSSSQAVGREGGRKTMGAQKVRDFGRGARLRGKTRR